MASYWDGLEVIDISDPTAPSHVESVTQYGYVSVSISGSYAYLSNEQEHTVEILDISDPSNITFVSMVPFANDVYPTDICVSGKYAYVSIYKDHPDYVAGIAIIDISNPSSPSIVGSDLSTISSGAGSVIIVGNYVYQATYQTFKIYDVSDPSFPHYFVGISEPGLDMAISGKYAYVTSFRHSAVKVIDISGINSPSAQIGSLFTNHLNVSENALIEKNLCVGGGLNVGPGGFYSTGSAAICAAVDNDGQNGVFKIISGDQKMLFDGNEIDTTHSTLHLNYNTGSDLQVGISGDGSEARANAWNAFSDLRLKQDITPITNPLSLLGGINGVYYTWKEGKDHSRQVGVIAQEIEKVLPEVVSEDLEGFKSVDYGKITALLIEAVKELRSQNQTLYQQNQTLHKENKEIKQDIKILQNALRM